MTIVQRMRAQLREAMKARDAVRTNFLRYWIAQLTLGTGEEVADDQAVKKMRGILKEAKAGQTTFSPEEPSSTTMVCTESGCSATVMTVCSPGVANCTVRVPGETAM